MTEEKNDKKKIIIDEDWKQQAKKEKEVLAEKEEAEKAETEQRRGDLTKKQEQVIEKQRLAEEAATEASKKVEKAREIMEKLKSKETAVLAFEKVLDAENRSSADCLSFHFWYFGDFDLFNVTGFYI